MARPLEILIWAILATLGGLAGYAIGGWYLRRQWSHFLEGEGT